MKHVSLKFQYGCSITATFIIVQLQKKRRNLVFFHVSKRASPEEKALILTDSLNYLSNASFSLQLLSFRYTFLSAIYASKPYGCTVHQLHVDVHLHFKESLMLDGFCYTGDTDDPPTTNKGSRYPVGRHAPTVAPPLYVNDGRLRATSRLYLISAPKQLATDGISLRREEGLLGLNLAPTFFFLTSSLLLSLF